jgi:RHS repeat-associated protein
MPKRRGWGSGAGGRGKARTKAIALGTSAGATDLLNLGYAYDDGTNHDKNNGNVIAQTIGVLSVGGTPGFVATQSYTYDELNRLKSATENSTPTGGSSAQSWKQTYVFDRFGNRTFDTSSGATTTLPSGFNPHIYNPTIDPSNNRFSSGQDYVYDSAGNVTQDATGKKFVCDGENKQTSFGTSGSSTNGGTYVYNGDGKRVKKIVGTEVTVFVYDVAGKMVAEYATTTPTSPQIRYLTADMLATPRINTDTSGIVIARHDYMPFGDEIISTGGRATSVGYAADTVRQKFTSKERDIETGLDYFGARYFASTQGRFTSPDPVAGSCWNPQSLNAYSYSWNNPLKLTDPTGMVVSWEDSEAKKKKDETAARTDAQRKYENPQLSKIRI